MRRAATRDALPPLRRALELNPKISNAHAFLGYCLMQLGKLKEASAEFDAEPTNFFRLSGLAIVDHKLGDGPQPKRLWATWSRRWATPRSTSRPRCWRNGEMPTKRSPGWSGRRQIGDSGLIYLATDPLLDPIRQHPGFTKIFRELNLSLSRLGYR